MGVRKAADGPSLLRHSRESQARLRPTGASGESTCGRKDPRLNPHVAHYMLDQLRRAHLGARARAGCQRFTIEGATRCRCRCALNVTGYVRLRGLWIPSVFYKLDRTSQQRDAIAKPTSASASERTNMREMDEEYAQMAVEALKVDWRPS